MDMFLVQYLLSLVYIMVVCSVCESVSQRETLLRVCGGKVQRTFSILLTVTAASALDCARICTRHGKCKSANFEKGYRRCSLFRDNFRNDCSVLESYENNDFLYMDNPCYFDMPYVNGVCQCAEGFTGMYCEEPPRDCYGYTQITTREIYVPPTDEKITVFCIVGNMMVFGASDGVYTDKPNGSWNDFKFGFGTPGLSGAQYWMGNEFIHRLTNHTYNYKMWLKVMSPTLGLKDFTYFDFSIDGESDGYTVHRSTYTVSPMTPAVLFDGSQFRTYDHNDDGCVSTHGAAFWYPVGCSFPSPLLGSYPSGAGEAMTKFEAYIIRI